MIHVDGIVMHDRMHDVTVPNHCPHENTNPTTLVRTPILPSLVRATIPPQTTAKISVMYLQTPST